MKYTRIIEENGSRYCVIDRGDGKIEKVKCTEFRGNSGRVKPKFADGARDGQELLETDTGKVFVFDEEIDDWNQIVVK